jgi:RecA/RadA recombinase
MKFPLSILNEFFKSTDAKEGLTSLWGDFGVGKTTLALQFAWKIASNSKNALYIYSKPKFPFNKLSSLFESNLEEFLENMQFIKSTNFMELFSLVFNLEFIILNRLKTGNGILEMIIIDSLTDLYRLELHRNKKEKNVMLNYKLNQILANLSFLSKQYHIGILITNELSKNTIEGEIYDVESGGNVMEYWVKNSIKIERTDITNNRKFILYDENGKTLSVLNLILTNQGFE